MIDQPTPVSQLIDRIMGKKKLKLLFDLRMPYKSRSRWWPHDNPTTYPLSLSYYYQNLSTYMLSSNDDQFGVVNDGLTLAAACSLEPRPYNHWFMSLWWLKGAWRKEIQQRCYYTSMSLISSLTHSITSEADPPPMGLLRPCPLWLLWFDVERRTCVCA